MTGMVNILSLNSKSTDTLWEKGKVAYSLGYNAHKQPRVGWEASRSFFIPKAYHALKKNNLGQIKKKYLLYSKEFITVLTFLTMVL